MNKENINYKLLKQILIYTLIFMVAAHGYCYVNLNFSHDSMRTFFWTNSDTIEIGRYIIPLFLLVRGKYYPPLLVGTLTYIFLGLTVYLIVNIFKIKDKKIVILTSGILATASTLTLLNATYIDFSDMYMLTILLMTFAAYLWNNYKKGYLYAIIPIMIGLGIYQSYICFFIGIVMLVSLEKLISNEDSKKVLIDGLKAIGTLMTSLVLYAISLKIVPLVTGVSLVNKYNGVSGVGNFGNINNLFSLIIGTYKATFNFIANPSTKYKTLIEIFNFILIITGFILLFYQNKKKKIKKHNKIIIAVLLLLLPFGINVVYLLGKGVEHQLMIYSLFLLYIFIISLEEKVIKSKKEKQNKYLKIINVTTCTMLSIVILSGIIYSNECYLKKSLDFDATITTMNRVIDRVEQVDGYEVGKTKVGFIGKINDSILGHRKKDFDYNSVGLGNNFSTTYYNNYKQYFENYLGYTINIMPEEKAKKYEKNQEVKEMKEFPYKDSVKLVDGVVIVKLAKIMEN